MTWYCGMSLREGSQLCSEPVAGGHLKCISVGQLVLKLFLACLFVWPRWWDSTTPNCYDLRFYYFVLFFCFSCILSCSHKTGLWSFQDSSALLSVQPQNVLEVVFSATLLCVLALVNTATCWWVEFLSVNHLGLWEFIDIIFLVCTAVYEYERCKLSLSQPQC